MMARAGRRCRYTRPNSPPTAPAMNASHAGSAHEYGYALHVLGVTEPDNRVQDRPSADWPTLSPLRVLVPTAGALYDTA